MILYRTASWIVIGMLCVLAGACTEIRKEPVEYSVDGTTLKGYLVYDDSLLYERPGVLIVHEWWGHNEYVRKRARMFAELGYTALAVDMYGEGRQAEHPREAAEYAKAVSQNMEVKKARFLAALDLLKQHRTVNPDKVAAIGYCFGGSVVLDMARAGVGLDAVVSFHGGLSTENPAGPGDIESRILVCHGEDDSMVTSGQVEAFRKEMENAGADYRVITYENAKHSFTNPDADKFAKQFDIPVGYNKQADEKSWEDMKEFLEQVFQ